MTGRRDLATLAGERRHATLLPTAGWQGVQCGLGESLGIRPLLVLASVQVLCKIFPDRGP